MSKMDARNGVYPWEPRPPSIAAGPIVSVVVTGSQVVYFSISIPFCVMAMLHLSHHGLTVGGDSILLFFWSFVIVTLGEPFIGLATSSVKSSFRQRTPGPPRRQSSY